MKHSPILIATRIIRISLILVLATVSVVGNSNNRYGTRRLALLSEETGICSLMDTLPDSCYYGSVKWKNHPISVRVSDGEISHLGIKLFSEEERESLLNSPVCDFLERYLLEHYVLGDKTESGLNRNKTERVQINKGRLEELHRLANDTATLCAISLEDGRTYSVSLWRNDREAFNMSFPASHRLLCGYEFEEDVEKLQQKIARTDSSIMTCKSSPQNLIPCDSIQGDYFIEKGSFCILPIVNNDRYYLKKDSTFKILNSPLYPVESLANLLVSGEVENQYTAKVRMLRYEGKQDEFSVPLNSLINCFIEEGCTPYFGLKGIYPSRDRITALFEMVNPVSGYEHLMSVEFDTTTIPKRKGEIIIRLTPYLPTHDIKSLF